MGYSLKYEDIVVGGTPALGAAGCALIGGVVFGGVHGMEPAALLGFALTSGAAAGAIGIALHKWRAKVRCPHQMGLWWRRLRR